MMVTVVNAVDSEENARECVATVAVVVAGMQRLPSVNLSDGSTGCYDNYGSYSSYDSYSSHGSYIRYDSYLFERGIRGSLQHSYTSMQAPTVQKGLWVFA